MFQKTYKKERNIPLIIIASFVVFYTLYIGASFIIPFIIATLFSFAIVGLSNFFKEQKVPHILSMILSLSVYLLIFWLIGELINSNIQDLIKKLPLYQDNISAIIDSFFNFINIEEPKSIKEMLDKDKVSDVFRFVLWELKTILSNAGMIFFYTLFIILEYRYVSDKLILMVSDSEKRNTIQETMLKIKKDTKAYFIIKTIISFLTALLSYILMKSFSLDFAIFWAFLIFILNFIPNIGSIIALIFPISLSLIQYETLYPFIFISIGLVWIQIAMWNVIEPRFMGNKLNLSPLAIIVSLSFWWALWWVVWMLLSVPLMVIINIILAKFSETRPIAILLSEKWELEVQTDEEVNQARQKFINKIKEKIMH